MNANLLVGSSPHLRNHDSTQRIMMDVLIALLPAVAAGTWFFGWRALLVVLVTTAVCIAAEYATRRVLHRDNSVSDLSAAVTGVLLALNLPPEIPLWMAAVGGVVAIVIVKQLFGGLGQNFMNPAAGARVFLLIAWMPQMTKWMNPADVVSSATPLAMLKGNEAVTGSLPSYLDLFVGRVGGSIGETSVLALLLGAAYLLYRRVITLEIPVAFIGTLALVTWIFGGETLFSGNFMYHVLAGGLMLGAFFMATDYSTSPVTRKGKIIMGVGCGLLTAVIRLYAGYPEGVSFAILLMNIVTPLIDRYTVPVSFGGERHAA